MGTPSLAMIANLIFTVIHRQTKQAEAFTTIVQMARGNMSSFANFIDVVKQKIWSWENREIRIIQLNLFPNWGGVVLKPSINGS